MNYNLLNITFIVVIFAILWIIFDMNGRIQELENREEHLSVPDQEIYPLSNEAIQDIGSVYTTGNMKIDNLIVRGNITADGTISSEGNISTNGTVSANGLDANTITGNSIQDTTNNLVKYDDDLKLYSYAWKDPSNKWTLNICQLPSAMGCTGNTVMIGGK